MLVGYCDPYCCGSDCYLKWNTLIYISVLYQLLVLLYYTVVMFG